MALQLDGCLSIWELSSRTEMIEAVAEFHNLSVKEFMFEPWALGSSFRTKFIKSKLKLLKFKRKVVLYRNSVK